MLNFKFHLAYLVVSKKKADVLQFEPRQGVYMKLPSQLDNDNRMLKFQSDTGGIYVFVERRSSLTWIAAVVVPIVLILIIVVATVVYFRLSPGRFTKAKEGIARTKRSMFPRV